MGIDVPSDFPLVDPAGTFIVAYDAFNGDGCEFFFATIQQHFSGVQVNAYFAAGGDCVQNNHWGFGAGYTNTRTLAISEA